MRIACVSDVCLGYGSPQITDLVVGLCEYYGADSLVVEPHRAELPPRHNALPRLRIRRTKNVFSPYSDPGRVEYVLEAASIIREYQPDLLVVACTFCLPVLFKLRKRPRFVIYYSYESIPFYGPFDVEMNRHLEGMVDLVIFSEENRAVREVGRFGFKGAAKAILYNCPNVDDLHPTPPGSRNGRIIYFGTIDPVMTLADYYTEPGVQKFPIDLYGPIRAGSDWDRQRFLDKLGGQIRYCGQLDRRELESVRKQYAYSLVIWNPSVENQLYAAPNKFFESIADGIPPIAAPHPQCKMVIERYGCGLLISDWSLTEFCRALERALRMYGGTKWREMVGNCERAARRELNWRHQFEKLKPHLARMAA